MASPMTVMMTVVKQKKQAPIQGICDLISKAFTTRNLVHFAHWNTSSYAKHMALGDLYDDIIEDIDEIVEVFQGKFGLVNNLTTSAACLPDDICQHVKDEADWVEKNRDKISNRDPSIDSLIDILLSHYHRTVYKLENLH